MAGYVGNIPVPQSTQTRQSFTATASQTSFPTIGYTEGFFDCHLNGVKLLAGVDFNVGGGNGSDVILATGAALNDILEVTIFDTFNTSSGTFSSTTLKNNVTLKNDTHEDSDGGRASKIIYQGEQSGGEISTLAEIQASHDGTADDQKGDLIFKTNDGSDNNAPTEAARIDSGQNLLVGKTAVGLSTTGIDLRSNGLIQAIRDGGTTVELNRQTSDGTLIDLRKDNSTVGIIGTQGGRLTIGDGATGLRIAGDLNTIVPWNTTTNALRDSGVDLGQGTQRFKDLYLSGGAYLGGTTSANYLNDYEEGTFTPTTSGLTYSSVATSYTKIGNRVLFSINLAVSASSASTAFSIGGLPFATMGTDGACSLAYSTMAASATDGIAMLIQGTVIYFFNSGQTITTFANVGSSLIRLSGSYNTNA